jgi:hypothetical protein
VRITGLDALDIRFPTSRARNGSDAMNPDPDYSAAYALIRTDDGPDGPRVHVHDRQGQRTRRHPRKRSRCSARRSTAADAAQAALLREEIRPEPRLSLDANQVWDVGQAIAAIGELRGSTRTGSRSRRAGREPRRVQLPHRAGVACMTRRNARRSAGLSSP